MSVQPNILFSPEQVISQMPHAMEGVAKGLEGARFGSRSGPVREYDRSIAGTKIDPSKPFATPFMWRGNQMASYQAATLPSGFSRLDAELPQAGWPYSTLIELLIQQPGIGEIQLLKPALLTLAQSRRIVFIQPPHFPQIAAFHSWDIAVERLLWIKSDRPGDVLWAAEQILRNGSCGAVLLWQTQVHSTALRRLHLAAQETNTAFWVMRPLAKAQEASPAPLRLILRPPLHPASGGIEIELIKRRGPPSSAPFYVSLPTMPMPSVSNLINDHATMDRRTPAFTPSRNIPTVLV